MNEECSIDVMLMEHDTPEDLHKCVCQTGEGVSILYFMFERVVDLYELGMATFYVILGARQEDYKYNIFFDFWTLCLMGLSPGVFFHWIKIGQYIDAVELDHTPLSFKFHWAIFSACLPACILSSLVFWSIVFSKNESSVFSIILNTVSPFLMITEFVLAAFPLRLLHFYFFTIFYLLYIFFTVIYQKCGGTGPHKRIPIYRVLDWRHPGTAFLYSLLGLVLGETIYVMFCFISVGKLMVRNSYIYD